MTWLDGNAYAGLLVEAYGKEMTAEERDCGSCGARSALGAHRAYRGAGVVLRCPSCGAVTLRIVIRDDRALPIR
jgi:uncharacterized Zn finger protein